MLSWNCVLDDLIVADKTGWASDLLLIILFSEPHNVQRVSLIWFAIFSFTCLASELLDDFTRYFWRHYIIIVYPFSLLVCNKIITKGAWANLKLEESTIELIIVRVKIQITPFHSWCYSRLKPEDGSAKDLLLFLKQ